MLDITAVVCSLVVLSIVSIALNCYCIYLIKSNTKFREKPSAAFVVNLLLIHIFQGVFVFPLYAAKKLKVENCFLQNLFNNVFLVSYIVTYYGACLSVLNIGLDRFLATYLLNRYKIYVTFRNVMIVLFLTWVYVLLMCSVPFIPTMNDAKRSDTKRYVSNTTRIDLQWRDIVTEVSGSTQTFKDLSNITLYDINSLTSTYSFNITSKKCMKWSYNYMPQNEWTVFMVFFNSALPLVMIIACYVYVVLRLKKLRPSKGVNKQKNNTLKVKEFNKFHQVTRLTQVLSATYTFCWSPSIVYYTVLSVCVRKCFPQHWDDSYVEKHLVYIIKYFLFINSLFSPLIYCYHHPELRQRLSRMRHTFAIQPEATGDKGYKLSIHHIELNDLALPNIRRDMSYRK